MNEIIKERRDIAIKRTREILEKTKAKIADIDYETMPLVYFIPKITDNEEMHNMAIKINIEIENLYNNIYSLYELIKE